MIARIWHGAVPAAKGDDYLERMRKVALPDYNQEDSIDCRLLLALTRTSMTKSRSMLVAELLRKGGDGRPMGSNIQLAGATIALDDVGEGPPVLLLHGFPATRSLWSLVAPGLVDSGFRVLVPDLVGYGASEAAPGVHVGMASQARWMFEILDALGIARAVVVAHDVGSAAAQLMVASAPRRVRGLAVLDGVCAGEWAMEAVASIQAWDPADAHRLFPVLARRLAKRSALREMLAAYEGEQGGLRLIRAARDLDPRQTEHIGEALRSSGVPALILWGENDEFLPIDSVARPLAELLGAPLVILPGGHFTPLDCPMEITAALREFLVRLPPER